ncbi:hypothetical protein [Streptomyces sp. DSM 40484]|uniref:hypothetical protein n=1 Tax=Streptomyces kroppenstedtii TaxID=3051181 RepID=UPI0028D444A8|nr:hypothetical protein [Streptomyces sp. DSM 40484]
MIRLPTTHAAITAPLVASNIRFPGIPIGRSLLDGRSFHLSPVQVDDRLLPSTSSLALGGLGSGKSTTAKARIRREIVQHGHQAVVIDSFGEDNSGEWAPLVRSLGGRVIEAGSFTLNPVSPLFTTEVREQLVRTLILAVEPAALTYQGAHALQHALTHPKATSLNGVVDALVTPEAGRWPVAKLTEWGEGAAIALSRFTEGSLQGLFDGQDASLPETDLPIISFDFSRLDRNSPAIPSLMAAVSCWAEQVWLRQSTAVHRHLVLEEAWQILLSPATSELIQRLLKNARKAGLSLDVVMHTLSDLGEGKAQDLARLCEIVHVGRLNPEEAAIVGHLLGLPAWAVDRIPTLDPGQAVWKVGPHHIDIVQTVRSEEEAALTDTSMRRRMAQQAVAVEVVDEVTPDVLAEPLPDPTEDPDLDTDADVDAGETLAVPGGSLSDDLYAPFENTTDVWDWEAMPPNVIDTESGPFDLARHEAVLQTAMEGRFSEAADLAAICEREDITTHGLNSAQALAWTETRAQIAELRGDAGQAAQLRATVTHMGDADWFERTGDSTSPAWHSGPEPSPSPAPAVPPPPARRRAWPYVAAIAALSITAAGVWQHAQTEQNTQDRQEKAAAYKGRSGAALQIDGVKADVVAHWNSDRDKVIIVLSSLFDRNARYLRIDAAGESASSVGERENGWFVKDPEIALPVEDPLADVTVRIAIGGRTWKEGARAESRDIRLSPTGVAFDAGTGEELPSDL